MPPVSAGFEVSAAMVVDAGATERYVALYLALTRVMPRWPATDHAVADEAHAHADALPHLLEVRQ